MDANGWPETLHGTEEFQAVTRSGESFVDADGFPIAKTVSHEIAEFIAAMLNRMLPTPPAKG